MSNKFISAKEVAAQLGCSTDTVKRRESELHLDRCRDKFIRKPRRYRTADARRELNDLGFEVAF